MIYRQPPQSLSILRVPATPQSTPVTSHAGEADKLLSCLTSDLTDSWVITNGGSEPISLTFSDPFWLETGFTHCYDYLRVTNTRTGESWDLCGEDVPEDMSLDTDKVEVTLFTDWANNHEGFRMTYLTSGEMNTTPEPTTPGSTTEGPSTSPGESTTGGGLISVVINCI